MQKGRLCVLTILCCVVVLAALPVLASGSDRVVRSETSTMPLLGCPEGELLVRTDQRFYFTVVISDVVDLYAWQADVTYNSDYLAYEQLVFADFLRSDGAAQFEVAPDVSVGKLDDAAVTRLSQHTGQDGSGTIAYVFFRALKDTGASTTYAKVSRAILADHNAVAIDKNYINSGNCRVAISDDAPYLFQPPVGPHIYLPAITR